tara:strand:+ start:7393 stop:7992 length:600 start_codon:yes stop_codon:yes gene_type:complete
MKKLILLTGVAILGLTGCVKLDGSLEVHEAIRLKSTKGMKTIPVGNHEAKLSWKSEKEFRLKLTEGRNKKFEFSVPDGMKLPQHRGEVSLTAAQTGQPVDIKAQINTKRSRTSTRYESERCHISRTVTRCHTDDQGQRICRDHTVTYSGYRRVQYHYVNTYTGFVMELSEPNAAEIKATFDGRDVSSRKVIEFEGRCII